MKPQVFYSALLLAGTLAVAGCTRSATDAVLPEETAPAVDEAAAVDAELAAQNATMQALLDSGLTQTAAARTGAAEASSTPEPPSSPPPTAAPVAGALEPVAITETALVEQVVLTMTSQAVVAAAAPAATAGPAATALPAATAVPQATAAPAATALPAATAVAAATAVSQATAAPAATAVRPATAVKYIVQPGDWIYKIARTYGISVDELLAGNPGVNKDALVPGQEIIIPAAGQVVIAPTNTTVYTVQAGDTLFAIALRNNTTTAALATLNNITNPDTLAPGDVLRIPN